MSNEVEAKGFDKAVGRWLGTSEVYDGNGRFVGDATDQRHVSKVTGENRVRVDLSFVGPIKFAGNYTIEDHKTFRLYQGPANYGFAETLSPNLIDAHAYWPMMGLSQRFMLMILPDNNRQMALAFMSRGEQLLYVIAGEYNRVTNDSHIPPAMVYGTAYDLHNDPTAGRGTILLQQPGSWVGTLQTLDSDLQPQASTLYEEHVVRQEQRLQVTVAGSAFDAAPRQFSLKTDQRLAWVTPSHADEQLDVVGSYSMSGGRVLSGRFHHLAQQRHVWKREMVTHDGTLKAVLHTWYRGGQRIGVQFGVLRYTSQS